MAYEPVLTAVFIYLIFIHLKIFLKINENNCIRIWYIKIKYVHLVHETTTKLFH